MRVLINEQQTRLTIPAGATVAALTPTLRPRLQGYRGALRADAFSANYVDRATVSFAITPSAAGGALALAGLQARLAIIQLPLSAAGSEDAFPALPRDVSGVFVANQGQLVVPVPDAGVVKVQLLLTNLSGNNLSFMALTQVFGDQRAIDVELVRELVGMNQTKPALEHALDS